MSEDYDDELQLTHYVWYWYPQLRTALEQRVAKAIVGQQKKAASPVDNDELYEELYGDVFHDPEVLAALEGGHDEFMRRTARRILREHRGHVFVNRCPECSRIVRTPMARQCLWCGHSWHDKPAHNHHSTD